MMSKLSIVKKTLMLATLAATIPFVSFSRPRHGFGGRGFHCPPPPPPPRAMHHHYHHGRNFGLGAGIGFGAGLIVGEILNRPTPVYISSPTVYRPVWVPPTYESRPVYDVYGHIIRYEQVMVVPGYWR